MFEKDGCGLPNALSQNEWNDVLRFFSRPVLYGALDYGPGCLLDGALHTLRQAPNNRRKKAPPPG